MDVWSSFMDLVHLIGAVGCALLVGAFTADGEAARALFYAVAALAFAAALLHRRSSARRSAHRVVDLRTSARPAPERTLQER